MATNYKLTFFNARARSEIPRLVFAAAKVDYEFVGVESEDWPALKPQTPNGTLPVLEIDGEQHAQGMAISVFLAGEFGLMGSSNKENFLIEQLLHTREDMMYVEVKYFWEKDAEAKAKLLKNMEEDVYPRYMEIFTKALKRNNGGSGFFLGDKLTLGDLVLYGALTTAIKNCKSVVDKYPELLAHRARIAEMDGIKEHLPSQPDTPI